MFQRLIMIGATAGALALEGAAQAQLVGGVDKAANGYSFDEASSEAAGPRTSIPRTAS